MTYESPRLQEMEFYRQDRRVPPGGGIVIGITVGLMMWACLYVLAK